jgi:hypothetical protein
LPSHFFEYGRETKLAAVAAALKEFEKGLKDAL